MSKKIIILLVIAVVAYSQAHSRAARRDDMKPQGAYVPTPGPQFQHERLSPVFRKAEDEARRFYSTVVLKDLGVSFANEKQIVSGVNFKIFFYDSPQNTEDQTKYVEIVVYIQPWNKIIKVTSIIPAVEGVTDQDGRILPHISEQQYGSN